MGAGFGSIGHAGNIHDDRFVRLIDRVLDSGQGDRAVGAAGRDDNGSAGAGVIIGQGGGAGESQIDRHGQARGRGQVGRHGTNTACFGDRAPSEAQGDCRRGIVVGNCVSVRRDGAQGGIGGIGNGDRDGLVELIERVIDHSQSDVLVGHARRKAQRAVGQRVVHPAACGRAAADGVIQRYRLAGDRRERYGQVGR